MDIKAKKQWVLNGFPKRKIIEEDKEHNTMIIQSKNKVQWLIDLSPREKPHLIKISCYYLPTSKI